ncbi:hypothetical protein M011DRAFT_466571 [Sporormia fimetaria CBS 119925]|uniref:Uncharacterized protein n=1 Tax=Sporormia fimetaria CBS 119925 TaxID=1340428 RepID=A0A6A6VE21_9PLEO|nr:hypothetical protein M011DRAFT_466571 [Sporormia fimetaria CBS 119925]
MLSTLLTNTSSRPILRRSSKWTRCITVAAYGRGIHRYRVGGYKNHPICQPVPSSWLRGLRDEGNEQKKTDTSDSTGEEVVNWAQRSHDQRYRHPSNKENPYRPLYEAKTEDGWKLKDDTVELLKWMTFGYGGKKGWWRFSQEEFEKEFGKIKGYERPESVGAKGQEGGRSFSTVESEGGVQSPSDSRRPMERTSAQSSNSRKSDPNNGTASQTDPPPQRERPIRKFLKSLKSHPLFDTPGPLGPGHLDPQPSSQNRTCNDSYLGSLNTADWQAYADFDLAEETGRVTLRDAQTRLAELRELENDPLRSVRPPRHTAIPLYLQSDRNLWRPGFEQLLDWMRSHPLEVQVYKMRVRPGHEKPTAYLGYLPYETGMRLFDEYKAFMEGLVERARGYLEGERADMGLSPSWLEKKGRPDRWWVVPEEVVREEGLWGDREGLRGNGFGKRESKGTGSSAERETKSTQEVPDALDRTGDMTKATDDSKMSKQNVREQAKTEQRPNDSTHCTPEPSEPTLRPSGPKQGKPRAGPKSDHDLDSLTAESIRASMGRRKIKVRGEIARMEQEQVVSQAVEKQAAKLESSLDRLLKQKELKETGTEKRESEVQGVSEPREDQKQQTNLRDRMKEPRVPGASELRNSVMAQVKDAEKKCGEAEGPKKEAKESEKQSSAVEILPPVLPEETKDSTPTFPPSSPSSPNPQTTTYKHLSYSGWSSDSIHTTTFSSPFDPTQQAIPLHQAITTLTDRAYKFLPHLTPDFEIIDVTQKSLVLRKLAAGQRAVHTITACELQDEFSRQSLPVPAASEERAMKRTRPERTLFTHLIQDGESKRVHVVTAMQKIDEDERVKSPNEAFEYLEHPYVFLPYLDLEKNQIVGSSKWTLTLRERFEGERAYVEGLDVRSLGGGRLGGEDGGGKKEEGMEKEIEEREKRAPYGALKTGIVAAAVCYVVGVVGELVRGDEGSGQAGISVRRQEGSGAPMMTETVARWRTGNRGA